MQAKEEDETTTIALMVVEEGPLATKTLNGTSCKTMRGGTSCQEKKWHVRVCTRN